MGVEGLSGFLEVGALHVVEVLGDLREGLGVDGKVTCQLGESVAGSVPGDELAHQTQFLCDSHGDGGAVFPHRGIGSSSSRELHQETTLPGLSETITGTFEIGGPAGEPHSEGGGDGMLTIGACHHEGLGMDAGKVTDSRQELVSAVVDEVQGIPDLEAAGSVKDVLGSGTVVDPGTAVVVKGGAQRVEAKSEGIARPPAEDLLHDGIGGLSLLGDTSPGSFRDHADRGLDSSQCSLDVIPALHCRSF